MLNQNDTICAIATALTPAGIGIIRVSGNEAIKIVSSIFVNKNKINININESHKIKYGFIYDKENDNFLDEVLCITMLAPHSYTAENVVEIQSHGSIIILKNILSLLTKNGCRIAEPGEFTKRAFLNGRIDLSKAEAVSDIITSKNEYALKASFNQLKGNLSEKINSYREKLLEYTAYIEACLDDPEHMNIDGFKPILYDNCNEILNGLIHIIKNYDNCKIIKEGINTVIIGKPNVGKSSLLNTLLNENRAIVTDIAGTTRDTIKETINLNGITLNIIDTAGIRNNNNIDEVEKIGIEKAKNEAKNADLIIFVIDSSININNDDMELFMFCKNLNKKFILLNNKFDINNNILNNNIYSIFDFLNNNYKNNDFFIIENDFFNTTTNINFSLFSFFIINFSAKTKMGFNELSGIIENLFINKNINFNNEIFISNERQKQSIINAKNSIMNVLSSIKNNMPEDLLTIDLTDTYTFLSQVLGIEVNDDIINEVFSKFCMGK